MSVSLRLTRIGRKKRPFYRIVAIDSRKARDGRFIESLGTYNPLVSPVEVDVKEERVLYWLGQGAIPSDTVKSFFRRKGILHKWHLIRNGADDAAIEEGMQKWATQQEERVKKAEALSQQEQREEKKTKDAEAKAATESKVAADAKATADAESKAAEEAKATAEAEAKAAGEAKATAEAEAKPAEEPKAAETEAVEEVKAEKAADGSRAATE